MIKGIIFDLDGTLLNTLADLTQSVNYALLNCRYKEKSFDEIRSCIGDGIEKLIEKALPEGKHNKHFLYCLDTFKKHYAMNMCNQTSPYKGILELLNNLNREKIKTAVVSNKYDAAVKNLCTVKFGNLIHIAIGTSDTILKKPSPDGIIKATQLLGLNINEVIYAGDSDIDIKAAKNAGVKSIGVTWGYKDKIILQKEKANHIVQTPDEILKIILNPG